MAEGKHHLRVTVSKAGGHGVHALLPSEPAFCVVEVPGQPQQKTADARVEKPGVTTCQWDQELDFEYEGAIPTALHVEVHGRLRSGVDDLVGRGDVDLRELLERGTRQVVEVPLRKGGKELGAVELCIQHQAMPERGQHI